MLLTDRIALITGAARGIGLATAERFVAEGAAVVLADCCADQLETAQQSMRGRYPGASITAMHCDVSIEQEVRDMFQAVFKQFRRLDILVSNAGILGDALVGMIRAEQIKNVFATNTFGAIYCAQYASRLMARNKRGSIINLASIMGVNGNTGQTVYGGSKAAVIGITKSLAKELAGDNVRVNAIAPGFINTSMAHSLSEDLFQERLGSVKMGRIGEPDEVAKVALFLASDLSSYVTGQIIGVDGGMVI